MIKDLKNSSLLRINQVLELIPVSRTTFYKGISIGKFPKPIKLGKCSFWHINDIKKAIAEMKKERDNA